MGTTTQRRKTIVRRNEDSAAFPALGVSLIASGSGGAMIGAIISPIGAIIGGILGAGAAIYADTHKITK